MKPLAPYEPNPLAGWFTERFFHHIDVDAAWVERIRQAATVGPVVYILRNLSVVDFFALDYLTKRYDLPRIRFVNDLGLFVFEPMQGGMLSALRHWATQPRDTERLRRALSSGGSAALFLKRPANLFEPKNRGRIEGDAFLRTLFAIQRETRAPIQLCPQVFVWSRGPDTAGQSPLDVVFGPREWPGTLRTVTQFVMNYRHVALRAGEPLDLADFLAKSPRENDEALLRRATYALLRRIERERRVLTGPLRKPVDRVRAEVIRSPKLQKLLGEMADEGDPARVALTDKVDKMLQEMEATPEPAAVPLLDKLFERTVRRMYQDILVDEPGLDRLRQASKDGTLVLLPNHRSHVDYIILSKIFHDAKMPVPLVAAGDNLNFFPAGPILRRAGAFYLRRSFRGDRLYAAVLEAYVRRLIREGHPLEFFLEGGRSRTGRLLPAKRGLLAMVVDSALGGGRPVYFCPIAINYERVPEEHAYVRELTGASKEREDARGLWRSARVLGQNYGHLSVEFAHPIALDDLVHEFASAPDSDDAGAVSLTPSRRRALVTTLANRTMEALSATFAVTPGALVATVLLAQPVRAVAHDDLIRAVSDLLADLRAQGARFARPLAASGNDATFAVLGALRLFLDAGHIDAMLEGAPLGSKERRADPGEGALYRVADESRLALDLAKSGIVGRFVLPGLAATALLATARQDSFEERVLFLARLLRHEFLVLESAESELPPRALASLGDRAEHDPPRIADGAAEAVALRARILEPLIESYQVAARTVQQLKPQQAFESADLTKRALATGDRMHAKGEIRCREALVRPTLDNAWQTFVHLGYLTRSGAELRVAEGYASPEMRRTIETRIASFRLA